jgi:hypothetical protein
MIELNDVEARSGNTSKYLFVCRPQMSLIVSESASRSSNRSLRNRCENFNELLSWEVPCRNTLICYTLGREARTFLITVMTNEE